MADGNERIFARFGCNDCGASFHTEHGPVETRQELRCEACDEAVLTERQAEAVACKKCGGAMKPGLDPMCPRCGSRNTLVVVPGMFFD
jgi:hypothetical protein